MSEEDRDAQVKINSAAEAENTRLKDDISDYESLMNWRRYQTLGLRVGAAALGAAASVCVGLQGNVKFTDYVPTLAALALAFSAMVTVVSAWDGVFNYKSDWERFKRAFGKLYGLHYRLTFLIDKGDVQPDDLAKIVEEHAQIIRDANTPLT